VLSPGSIDAIAPSGSATARVTVTSPGGTSAASVGSQFSYVAPPHQPGAPTVTSISPSSGPLAGGSTVTMAGTGLSSAAIVSFGDATTSQIKVISGNKIEVTVPAGQSAGAVAVTVTAAGADSAPNASSLFRYQFSQTLSFTSAPPSPALYGGSYKPAATGGTSGEPVTLTVGAGSKACQMKDGVVTFKGPGNCVVDGNQAGTANYAAAPQVQQSIPVGLAPLTVTAVDESRAFGAANPALTAKLSGFVLGQTQATSGVKGTAACTSPATATSPPGQYPITCTQGSLEAANYGFTSFMAGTLTIKPASG
jgi:MBG domain (YGX type)/IPT/TIG domain